MFETVGKVGYIKLPKPETNPRGVEITREALEAIVGDRESRAIEIYWQRPKIEYNPYQRWVDYWREE